MEKQIYRFNNEIDTIEVHSMGAKIIVKPHDEAEIYAEYNNPKNIPEFCAVLSGKTLTFKEKLAFTLFSPKPDGEYNISVLLPLQMFSKLKISTASGGAEIEGVTAQELVLNTASGNININAYFENVKIQSASGCIILSNPEKATAKTLSVCTVSGNAEITGYKAEEYNLHSVSGVTKYNSASGKGKIAVTSGCVDVAYEDWNDDLDISAISGNINISLPENAGMDLKFDGVSGSIRTDIGAEKGKFMNLGKGTSGVFGGENSHSVKVSLTSGNVVIGQG